MGQGITPIFDTETERVKEQLAQADALRKMGLEGNTGSGYQGGRVFIVGNPLGNIASGLAGAFLGEKARTRQGELEQQQQTARDEWLGQMPSGVDTQHYDPVANPGTGPLAEGMEVPQSPLQQAKAMQSWAMKAPRGMEGVQNFALQQSLTAPQREAEATQKAQDRLHELQLKSMDARATQAERLDAQKEIARMQIEGRKEIAGLAASMRASGKEKADPTDYADAIHDAALKSGAGDNSWRLGMPKELWGPVQNEASRLRRDSGMTDEQIASSPNDFKERMALQRNYVSGQASKRINAFNTALAHMDTMENLGKGLAGTDIPAANAVMNYVAKQTGSPGPVSFDTAKTFVAKEMSRAFQEVGAGSSAERAHVEELFNSAKTPAQLNGAIKTSRELMSGQLKTLEQPYKGTLKREDFRERFLTPAARKQMEQFSDKGAAAPAGGGNTVNFNDLK